MSGAGQDPTNVTGRRAVAYLLDVVVASLLLGGLIWALEINHYRSSDLRNYEDAGQYCTDVNQPGPNPGGPFDPGPVRADPNHEFCFNIGTTAYVLLGDEVAEARLHVISYSLGFSLLYWVLIPGLAGASFAKWVLGLRVVKADGSRAGVVSSAIRWLLLVIDASFCAVPALVLITTTSGHRRLGDLAARTYVVRRADAGVPVAPTEPPAPRPRVEPALPLGLTNEPPS